MDEELYQALIEMGLIPQQPQFGTFDENTALPDPYKLPKSWQSYLNQQPNLLGFDPISQYGGSEFEPYTPMSEIMLDELDTGTVGTAIRAALEAGEGIFSVRDRLSELRKRNIENPDEGISKEDFEAYQSFLNNYAKARAKDQVELSNREAMDTEGDPFGEVFDPEAQVIAPEYQPTVAREIEENVAPMIDSAVSGPMIERRADAGRMPGRQLPVGRASNDVFRSLVGSALENAPLNRSASRRRRGTVRSRSAADQRRGLRRNVGLVAENATRAYSRGNYRPSIANDRARANINAFRAAHGLPPG